jgi:hypothetical protein
MRSHTLTRGSKGGVLAAFKCQNADNKNKTAIIFLRFIFFERYFMKNDLLFYYEPLTLPFDKLRVNPLPQGERAGQRQIPASYNSLLSPLAFQVENFRKIPFLIRWRRLYFNISESIEAENIQEMVTDTN